jgi:hypothetical protein
MEKFKLPDCVLPKPGENVVCFTNTTRMIGKANGYNREGMPIIIAPTGHQFTPLDSDSIRLENPYRRIEPAWKYLQKNAIIREATIDEKKLFDSILNQKLPGNSTYLDFITEVWYRGYEIFLVGGTVRDVINGEKSNDVDLVTSMPLAKVYSLATSMFGFIPKNSCKYNTGYLKIGGSLGDPFMDLKTFCSHGLGTDHVIFGNNIHLDTSLRDFACNSIYYEPINQLLIDPSGIGIRDAEEKRLTIVADKAIPNRRYQVGTIPIRFMKFVLRGYIYSEEEHSNLINEYIPELRTMKISHRTSYLIAQIRSKSEISNEEAIVIAKETFKKMGINDAWETYFTKSNN